MMELLIDTIGAEDEVFELLKGFGPERNPDIGNCCFLPDGTDKAAVEAVLNGADIAYQWVENDELIVIDGEDDEEDYVEEEEEEEDEEDEPPQKDKK